MSFARKVRRAQCRIAARSAVCAECGGAAELGVTDARGSVLLYCRPCARALAKRLDLPALQKQLDRDEPS
jgi:hypothetical protein